MCKHDMAKPKCKICWCKHRLLVGSCAACGPGDLKPDDKNANGEDTSSHVSLTDSSLEKCKHHLLESDCIYCKLALTAPARPVSETSTNLSSLSPPVENAANTKTAASKPAPGSDPTGSASTSLASSPSYTPSVEVSAREPTEKTDPDSWSGLLPPTAAERAMLDPNNYKWVESDALSPFAAPRRKNETMSARLEMFYKLQHEIRNFLIAKLRDVEEAKSRAKPEAVQRLSTRKAVVPSQIPPASTKSQTRETHAQRKSLGFESVKSLERRLDETLQTLSRAGVPSDVLAKETQYFEVMRRG